MRAVRGVVRARCMSSARKNVCTSRQQVRVPAASFGTGERSLANGEPCCRRSSSSGPRRRAQRVSDYLGLHPEIHMSRNKEPHSSPAPKRISVTANRVERRADYQRLFQTNLRVRGEGIAELHPSTPATGVPERIRRDDANGDVVAPYCEDDLDHTIGGRPARRNGPQRRARRRGELDQYLHMRWPLHDAALERYLPHFKNDDILVLDQHDSSETAIRYSPGELVPRRRPRLLERRVRSRAQRQPVEEARHSLC